MTQPQENERSMDDVLNELLRERAGVHAALCIYKFVNEPDTYPMTREDVTDPEINHVMCVFLKSFFVNFILLSSQMLRSQIKF